MGMRKVLYSKAINEALHEEMARDQRVITYGEDVGVYGGLFRCTEGLQERFGVKRCFETPISEAMITGTAVGSAIAGLRPVIEIMFMDWIGLTLDCMVNQAAVLPYSWDGQVRVPMVMRTQGGAGSKGSPQHTKSLEAWLYHIPGLKVIMPSTPYDAKGLLKAAIRDDNPVVYIEHKMCYPMMGEVPEEEYLVEIGKADVKRVGSDITVVAISKTVHDTLAAAEELAQEEGISVEVIDPRTLKPLDMETIVKSVKKTNKALVVNEAWRTGCVASDIVAQIQEKCFDDLDAPIARVTSPDVHTPYALNLENLWMLDKKKIKTQILKMLK
jgi:pyruvate/2-oxoglutarate/acetoin dehydrogenase E1 component